MDKYKIPSSMLLPEIEIDRLGFADTSELSPLEEPLGQARAHALDHEAEHRLNDMDRQVVNLITEHAPDAGAPVVAELAAVLSSLADVLIRQYLAVTGSVNQLGEIQPIGGVNEKIGIETWPFAIIHQHATVVRESYESVMCCRWI